MSQETKQYKLGKRKQLIDLNQDSVNFDLTFKVTCHTNDTLFNLLVVDQTTLDNNGELKYKEVKNTISGNIISDKFQQTGKISKVTLGMVYLVGTITGICSIIIYTILKYFTTDG